jgi:murein DD-endopeptidase MepM/ murein hydrolase activator NlpD
MAHIIENQNIAKRQKGAHSRYSNRSAGCSREFMSHFSQKPVSSKRKKTSLFKKFSLPLFTEKTPNKKKTNKSSTYSKSINRGIKEKTPRTRTGGSGFSFPIPSLATVAVIAGTLVIALTALNWEDFNISTLDTSAFQFPQASTTGPNTIQYAATGIPSILPFADALREKNESENLVSSLPATASGSNANDDAHHGMLITFEWQPYRVQRGDSVSTIAQRFGVSVGAIIASNDITNARRLQTGALLRIPNIDGIPYQIKRGDSLSRIAASFNVPLEVILDVNDIKSDNIRPGETLFIPGARMNDIDLRMSLGELFMFPLATRHITSPFGMRRDPFTGALQFHAGVDFRANIGTTVMASLDGVVSVVGENWLYGKYIIMTHSNGYKTLYGHLNSFAVREGDRVARGRKIGEVGNTGYSTGPHLHFGIYDRNNKLVNPLELLR